MAHWGGSGKPAAFSQKSSRLARKLKPCHNAVTIPFGMFQARICAFSPKYIRILQNISASVNLFSANLTPANSYFSLLNRTKSSPPLPYPKAHRPVLSEVEGFTRRVY
jgi:hypothetical protein